MYNSLEFPVLELNIGPIFYLNLIPTSGYHEIQEVLSQHRPYPSDISFPEISDWSYHFQEATRPVGIWDYSLNSPADVRYMPRPTAIKSQARWAMENAKVYSIEQPKQGHGDTSETPRPQLNNTNRIKNLATDDFIFHTLDNAEFHLSELENLSEVDNNPKINLTDFTDRTTTIVFTLGEGMGGDEIIYEQGGKHRGINFLLKSETLRVGLWNYAEENWGYKELTANVAQGTLAASLVIEGELPSDGFARLYIGGVLADTVSGVGQLYEHNGGIGLGQINGATRIAGNKVTAASSFSGELHELIIHHYNLDPDKVAALHNELYPERSSENEIHMIMSYGQSLSVGAGGNTSLSINAPFGDRVLEADSETGLRHATVEGGRESHMYGMLNRIASNFEKNGLESPTLLGTSSGTPGQSIQSLFTSSEDFYPTIEQGLAATSDRGIFYVPGQTEERYDIYTDDGDVAVSAATNVKAGLFDKLIADMKATKAGLDQAGLGSPDSFDFVWIQGQSNGNHAKVGSLLYSDVLSMLVERVEETASYVFEKDVSVQTFVVLNHGYGKGHVAWQQRDFIENTTKSWLAAVEKQYQIENPEGWDFDADKLDDSKLTHLNSIGYNMMGQDIGDTIYGAMTGALGEDDFIRIKDVSIEGQSLLVAFSGLRGRLVEDRSLYENLAEVYMPPNNYGFDTFGSNAPNIIDADIVSDIEVMLHLDSPVTSHFSLRIGRQKSLDGSSQPLSSLRDSVVSEADNFVGHEYLDGAQIRNFVSTQIFHVDLGEDFTH